MRVEIPEERLLGYVAGDRNSIGFDLAALAEAELKRRTPLAQSRIRRHEDACGVTQDPSGGASCDCPEVVRGGRENAVLRLLDWAKEHEGSVSFGRGSETDVYGLSLQWTEDISNEEIEIEQTAEHETAVDLAVACLERLEKIGRL